MEVRVLLAMVLAGCPGREGDTGEVPDRPDGGGRDSGEEGDADTDADADTDSDADADGDCDVRVLSTWPEDGAVDAYYRGAIEFELSDPDPTAVVEMGVSGTQSASDDETVIRFTPDAPLMPDSSYTATLHFCRGSVEIAFSTSSIGLPLDAGTELVGGAWLVDNESIRLTAPPDVGALLMSYLDASLLLGVAAVGDDGLSLLLSLGREGRDGIEQDTCEPTPDMPVARFDDPHFSMGSGTISLDLNGVAVTLDKASLAGDFSSDGTRIEGFSGAGTLDTRPLDPLVSEDAEEGYVCALAAGLGVSCIDCADGEPYCVDVVFDRGVAARVEGGSVIAIAGTHCDGCVDGVPEDASAECPTDPDAGSGSSACMAVAASASLAWAGVLAVAARRQRRQPS